MAGPYIYYCKYCPLYDDFVKSYFSDSDELAVNLFLRLNGLIEAENG